MRPVATCAFPSQPKSIAIKSRAETFLIINELLVSACSDLGEALLFIAAPSRRDEDSGLRNSVFTIAASGSQDLA
jgi:hypothetical protein